MAAPTSKISLCVGDGGEVFAAFCLTSLEESSLETKTTGKFLHLVGVAVTMVWDYVSIFVVIST